MSSPLRTVPFVVNTVDKGLGLHNSAVENTDTIIWYDTEIGTKYKGVIVLH